MVRGNLSGLADRVGVADHMVGDRRKEIVAEARRVEESARTASETQFEYAKSWRRIDRALAGLAAVLAAVAGVGGLADLLGSRAAGTVAIAAAGIAAVSASLNAPQTKEKAAGSANAYRNLQQDARIFWRTDSSTMGDEECRDQLASLVARLQELNQAAEIPSAKAWRRAKRQLDEGAQDFEADS